MTNVDLLASLLGTHIYQVSLLLAVVAILSLSFARKTPRFIFVVWVIFFIKCVTPPILQSPISVYGLVNARSQSQFEMTNLWLGGHLPSRSESSRLGLHSLSTNDRRISQSSARQIEQEKERKAMHGKTAKRSSTQDLLTSSSKTKTANAMVSPFGYQIPKSVYRCFFFVWGFGTLVLMGLLFGSWIIVYRRILRERVPVPAWLIREVANISREMGIRRRPEILVTRSAFGPFAVGWMRPWIVLPAQMLGDEFRQHIRPVLAHEICHVKRRDTIVGSIQCLAQIIFWFHPVVWWARRHANQICELCCDEEAIACLQLRPKAYAKSLLAVVDAKRLLRPVLATSAINQAEITKRRLREIMKPKTRTKTNPIWCWIVAVAALPIVLPAAVTSKPVFAQEKNHASNVTIQKVRSELAAGNFEKAEAMCRELIDQDEKNALAIQLLGYTLHAAGNLDEAVEYHQRATEFPTTKALGYYNLACVHALRNQPDEALEKLKLSLKAGLSIRHPITSDTDFASLYDNEEFKEIARKFATPNVDPITENVRAFDFWVGHWNVVNDKGEAVGKNIVTIEESGNLIREQWTSVNGSTGQSINYFDPAAKKLKQTWVDSKGQVMEMVGNVLDGELSMQGTAHLQNGKQALCRTRLKKLADARIRQIIEMSYDNGATWDPWFAGHYQKVQSESLTTKEASRN